MRQRLWALLALAAVSALVASGCSDDAPQPAPTTSSRSQAAEHGPFFPECGGLTEQAMAEVTQVKGLVTVGRNDVGCQWMVGGQLTGPNFSFTWFRGSPMGRERKTEELTRVSVEDVNIDGHSGWIAIGDDPTLGKNLCEVGIGFGDDFFEWSALYTQKPFPDPCDVAKELAHRSITAAK